ncbi:MAG: hypothetical protein RLY14_3255 [Planctomycetota bacterium]|jgi:hypothetical protein
MKTPKSQNLQRIRSQSAYKTYRFFAKLVAILIYIYGTFRIFDAFVSFLFPNEPGSALKGLLIMHIAIIIGIIYIVLGKVLKEALLMLADIADSVTDMNTRNDQDKEENGQTT